LSKNFFREKINTHSSDKRVGYAQRGGGPKRSSMSAGAPVCCGKEIRKEKKPKKYNTHHFSMGTCRPGGKAGEQRFACAKPSLSAPCDGAAELTWFLSGSYKGRRRRGPLDATLPWVLEDKGQQWVSRLFG
jgi:hypothetical protein